MLYSTNHKAKEVNIKQAILKGLAEDKGLYMPRVIPKLTEQELENLKDKEYYEIAYIILRKYLNDFIDDQTLKQICKESYNFPVPIEKLDNNLHILRLDQGPTAAFKDFAARAMARIMQHFLKQDKKELLILTATSGDTGSAVANAFHNINNIKVIVLFPKDEVTINQRKLMTTLGDNITAIAVDGKFDDCQELVKEAFVDPELKHLPLSSANSINIARLIPQIVYYVYTYAKLGKVNFSVPSGNFGDLIGGLLAKEMGVPINKFIVAVNENDEFVNYYNTNTYKKISPSKACLSNAMNVGHPSNFARLVTLYNGIIDEKGNITKQPDIDKIKQDIWTISVTDKETKQEIKEIHEKYQTIIEPHGAVGLFAYKKYKEQTDDNTITVCLETAHPAKFPETVKEVLNIELEMPECMKLTMQKEEYMYKLDNDYQDLKKFLLKDIDWIKVFAPATIGNIGPGFDVLGLAVKGLGDVIEARKIKKGLVINEIDADIELSKDPKENTVTIAAQEVLDMLNIKEGIEFNIRKGMPCGSGLGSSAASAAAGAFAANYLYGNKLSKEELILPATKAEAKVSGGFFADNTAPSLLGGETLTRSCEPLDVTKIGSIEELKVILVTPNITILTKNARAILPKAVPMEDFIHNMANTALITAAFAKNDYSLFARSLNDHVIEPVRKTLIKGFDNVKTAALNAGADGMTISGSGPTVFAITNDSKKAEIIKQAMLDAFAENNVKATAIITEVDDKGTRLINKV